MSIVYQVRSYAANYDQEFDSENHARLAAMVFEHAELIKWHVSPNLPRRQPDLVCRSCALSVWEAGAWRDINIHG